MRHDLSRLIDEAIFHLDMGESLEECLAHYPQEAEQLEPLLRIALNLRQTAARPLPAEMEQWLITSRRTFIAQAEQVLPQRLAFHPQQIMQHLVAYLARLGSPSQRRIALTLALCLIMMSFSFPIADVVAAQSLPGDALYSIKLTSETLHLALTFNSEQRSALYVQYANRRVAEVSQMVKQPDAKTPQQLQYTIHLLGVQVQGAMNESQHTGKTEEVQEELATLLDQADVALDHALVRGSTSRADQISLTEANAEVAALQENLPSLPPVLPPTPIARQISPQPVPQPSPTPVEPTLTTIELQIAQTDATTLSLPIYESPPTAMPTESTSPAENDNRHPLVPTPKAPAPSPTSVAVLPPPSATMSMPPVASAPIDPIPTATPFDSPVPTSVDTATLQPTSPTPSPTISVQPTETATKPLPPTATTLTATSVAPSPSPSEVATLTLTATAPSDSTTTPTITGTVTLSPTITSTVSPEPTITGTVTLSPTITSTVSPEPTITSTVTLSPTITSTVLPEPTTTSTVLPEPTTTDTALPEPTTTDTALPEPTTTDTALPEPTTTDTVTPEPAMTPTATQSVLPTTIAPQTPTASPTPILLPTDTKTPTQTFATAATPLVTATPATTPLESPTTVPLP